MSSEADLAGVLNQLELVMSILPTIYDQADSAVPKVPSSLSFLNDHKPDKRPTSLSLPLVKALPANFEGEANGTPRMFDDYYYQVSEES